MEHTDPKVTRRFTVSPIITIYELHYINQIVMGWANSNKYQFNHDENIIADPRLEDDELGPLIGIKHLIVPTNMCQFVSANGIHRQRFFH